jgi:hypothetical protein
MSQEAGKKRVIDGIEFEVFMLDPWVANEILHDLFHIFGPSIRDVFGAMDGDVKSLKEAANDTKDWAEQQINMGSLGSAIGGLFQRMDSNLTKSIMEKLAAVTMVKDKGKLGDQFQLVFLGKLGTMYKWVAFALEVQLADFFGSIPAAMSWFSQRAALGR